jgi:7-cyano-7-deazaguanine reductase
MVDPLLAHAPLGRDVAYPSSYDPGQLFPIARAINRQSLGPLPAWVGADIWNAYEVSWLNPKGKPIVGMARFTVPQSSPNLIESKSFKLYLNSFNETRLESTEAAQAQMAHDLGLAAGETIRVELLPLQKERDEICRALPGTTIDDLDIAVHTYQPAPELLRCLPNAKPVSETLTSDLLKTNCPVTGQPDWGSVQIRYQGPQIDRAALLEYIVSLRRHSEFHEHCVEQMYCDIWQACRPESLLVYARYTRRGGLDINPWRASSPAEISQTRTPRQ